jgi:superfamily II DNA/RNA helicase
MAAVKSFSEMGIDPFVVRRLSERGIEIPTEVQERVIPRILNGESVIFRSATGTGKTFAYLLPMLQLLGGGQLLILAPTYELCSQIKQEADFLFHGAGGAKAGLLIGSGSISRQIDMIKKDKPCLLVGNPGRVLQLIRMGKLRPARVRFLVFDEGDRLVSDELYGETREIAELVKSSARGTAGAAPSGVPCALCSATLPPKYGERFLVLCGQAAREDVRDNEVLRDKIEHWAFFSEDRGKIGMLCSFLAAVKPRKALVFTGRGAQVGNIVARLQYHKIPALGIFGDMDKKARKHSIDEFRKKHTSILVCSDLAARGLDIPDISHIIALDAAEEADSYIHRAGRTARAGRRGIMAVIGNEADLRNLARVEKKLGITVYPKALYKGQVCVPESPPEGASSGGV